MKAVELAHHYNSNRKNGYYYKGDRAQSSVPFFPAYPLLMRGLHNLFGGDLVTWGIPITFLSGLLSAVLIHRWCLRRFGPKSAAIATVLKGACIGLVQAVDIAATLARGGNQAWREGNDSGAACG